MTSVRIAKVATAYPGIRVCQGDVPRLMGLKGLAALKARAVVRGSRIGERRIVLDPEGIRQLGSIEDRNHVYREEAPRLALAAAAGVVGGQRPTALVTTSCTGYCLPGWALDVVERLGLGTAVMRLPITEAGCAGGVVALGRAGDYCRVRPGASALAVAVELCSLAFHQAEDEGVLTANLIFGDGAGAALVMTGPGEGLEIVDTESHLVPGTRDALGFDLTDAGFYPVLSRRLIEILPGAMILALERLLSRNGMACTDVDAWLVHPGGARILGGIERALGLSRGQVSWSWDALREHGNTSSAAIFDVLGRYLAQPRPEEWAVVAAFGPGVSIELMLARRRC